MIKTVWRITCLLFLWLFLWLIALTVVLILPIQTVIRVIFSTGNVDGLIAICHGLHTFGVRIYDNKREEVLAEHNDKELVKFVDLYLLPVLVIRNVAFGLSDMVDMAIS